MCRYLSLHMGMCRYMQVSLEARALDPLGLVWWLWDAKNQTPVLEEQQASCPLNHLYSPKNSPFFFFLDIASLLNKEAIFRHWLQGLHRLVTCVPTCIPIFLLFFLWLSTHPNIFHLFGFCDHFLVVSRVKGLFILQKGIKVDFYLLQN